MPTTDAPGGLHLIKLAVGCETADDLARRQAAILARDRCLRHRTRQCPRRRAELLAGGSIYWVVRGQVLLRQRLLAIEVAVPPAVERRCTLLLLDPTLMRTAVKAQRPFQGWRYLAQAAAPRDLGPFRAGTEAGDDDAMPAAMQAELRALGLL